MKKKYLTVDDYILDKVSDKIKELIGIIKSGYDVPKLGC